MKRHQLKVKHEPNQYVIYRLCEFIACHVNVELILTFLRFNVILEINRALTDW